jgi:hypothetical protein
MYALDKIAWEVLNATADDWENLEQIYHMVCFDFSAENYADREHGAYYLRPARRAASLKEIADRVAGLMEQGLFEARDGDSGDPVTDLQDRSYVWRAWFRMTPAGRQAWDSSEYATLAEQEQPQ